MKLRRAAALPPLSDLVYEVERQLHEEMGDRSPRDGQTI
jgi:hypothetical protein